MHESCVWLSPCLHEKVIQVLIVLICNQLYKEFSRGWVANFEHAVLDCHL